MLRRKIPVTGKHRERIFSSSPAAKKIAPRPGEREPASSHTYIRREINPRNENKRPPNDIIQSGARHARQLQFPRADFSHTAARKKPERRFSVYNEGERVWASGPPRPLRARVHIVLRRNERECSSAYMRSMQREPWEEQ